MGADGGSIAGRDLLVRVKQNARVDFDQSVIAFSRLTQCTITGDELQSPVMACELGNLYNKEAILTHLLSKNDVPQLRHIRGLKDLIECKITFTREHNSSENSKSAKTADGSNPKLITCPLSQVTADGKIPFIVVRGCGCVLSLKAFTEIVQQDTTCPVCDTPFAAVANHETVAGERPYITLAGDTATMDELREVMVAKRFQQAEKKKDKKKSKRLHDSGSDGSTKRAKVDVSQFSRVVETTGNDKSNDISLSTKVIMEETSANVLKMKESKAISDLFHSSPSNK
jgi:hypothetical protein